MERQAPPTAPGPQPPLKLEGGQVLEELRRIVHEGNVRKVVVKQEDRVIAEFPLSIGVVGVALAPVLAAVGTVLALVADCTIEIERATDAQTS